jgi:hypothetical protein
VFRTKLESCRAPRIAHAIPATSCFTFRALRVSLGTVGVLSRANPRNRGRLLHRRRVVRVSHSVAIRASTPEHGERSPDRAIPLGRRTDIAASAQHCVRARPWATATRMAPDPRENARTNDRMRASTPDRTHTLLRRRRCARVMLAEALGTASSRCRPVRGKHERLTGEPSSA